MDYSASFQISASGMAVEKLRLDVTAANLANMNNAATSATAAYQPLRVLAQEVPLGFARQFTGLAAQGGGVSVGTVTAQALAPRMAFEPGHPYADAKGFVAYPGVDHTSEMLNLNVALRTYEANVTALNAAKVMATRTLDIGAQS
jgi:flagellar basal-body rod protein FlgC